MASIRLNVFIVHKKGIDKGLVLVSEMHQVEEIGGEESVNLVMKNGLRLELSAHFLDDYSMYGPSEALEVEGEVFLPNGDAIGEFSSDDSKMFLGKEKLLVFSAKDQLVEIKIVPEIH